MMVDLAAHGRCLAAHRIGQIGRLRGGGVGDHRQRGLERMGEVAGMTPRFLGLLFAVGQQGVDLMDQRKHFAREILGDPPLTTGSDGDHFAPYAAQRPQAVTGLQCGQHQQPEPERGEASHQGRAQIADLAIDDLARLRHLEPPAGR